MFFDPDTGDVLICDNDNVSANGIDNSSVYGTPRFMAPEIVMGQAKPSRNTDLYSLAVLLFYMFMMGHPLEGKLEAEIKCMDIHAMNKLYGMRLEKTGHDRWLTTWAFPIKESSAKREGYDKVQVKGDISFADDYPGCPYCGGHGLTLCSCGHLSCTILRNNIFTCEWCGTQGQIGDYSGETITAGTDY